MKTTILLILGASALVAYPALTQEPAKSSDAKACCADAAVCATLSMDCVKRMAGTWVTLGPDGRPTDEVVSEYRITAGGSAVIETLFPGQEHEMITMYYQSGDDVKCTHYCAFGNHPTFKLTSNAETGEMLYSCVGSGANFENCAETVHMHEGRLKMVAEDRAQTVWQAYEDGKPSKDHRVTFELARVK